MYSAYGTFNYGEGITIGDTLGNSIDKARALTRIAVAAGYKLNLATTLKAEIMKDRLFMSNSQYNPGNGRLAYGFQAVMKF